jgi:hypothetical protein
MAENPSFDIEIVDVKQMIISTDPAEGATITVEVVGEQNLDMHLPAHVLAKLESFLARANAEQANRHVLH